MRDDLEYLKDCLNAIFFIFQNSIILSDISNTPSNEELKEHSIKEIEALHGHFHMSLISSDYDHQKNHAFEIWKTWRQKINKTLPNEKIRISILDDGVEVILAIKRLE